jgi:hypothetical protein
MMNEHDTAIQETLEKLLKIECLKAAVLMDESPNMLKIKEYLAQADSLLQTLDQKTWDQETASCDGRRPLSP